MIETAIDISNTFTTEIFMRYYDLYKIKDKKKYRLLNNKDLETFEKNIE